MPAEDQSLAEQHNREGNRALREQDYERAIGCYTSGLLEGRSAKLRSVLLSNRSSAHAHLERWDAALTDAVDCLSIRADWSRSHACHGAALEGIGRPVEALKAFKTASELDPENTELSGIVAELEQMSAADSARKPDRIDPTVMGDNWVGVQPRVTTAPEAFRQVEITKR
jgi:stress-induced-phosphoprotein 1